MALNYRRCVVLAASNLFCVGWQCFANYLLLLPYVRTIARSVGFNTKKVWRKGVRQRLILIHLTDLSLRAEWEVLYIREVRYFVRSLRWASRMKALLRSHLRFMILASFVVCRTYGQPICLLSTSCLYSSRAACIGKPLRIYRSQFVLFGFNDRLVVNGGRCSWYALNGCYVHSNILYQSQWSSQEEEIQEAVRKIHRGMTNEYAILLIASSI